MTFMVKKNFNIFRTADPHFTALLVEIGVVICGITAV